MLAWMLPAMPNQRDANPSRARRPRSAFPALRLRAGLALLLAACVPGGGDTGSRDAAVGGTGGQNGATGGSTGAGSGGNDATGTGGTAAGSGGDTGGGTGGATASGGASGTGPAATPARARVARRRLRAVRRARAAAAPARAPAARRRARVARWAAGGSTPTGPLTGGNGFYRMERLTRGVVAVKVSGGVYVGWRMLGFEYDAANPSNVAYNVYRDGTKLATVTDSTNYQDASGTMTSTYTVRAVIGGTEGADSEKATVWAQNYLRVPLMVPPAGTSPGSPQCETANERYTYSANDASVGDVDGDGVYEIFLKWDPSNSKDNSQSGCTGNVYIDAYKLDGTRLWRIDLGRNIRAGAHYTQFMVADFDGDGKAEMAVKTAPGTKDGTGAYLKMGPAASDDDNADYRSVANDGSRTGYVLTGPEYLSVFNGQTGAEMATVAFDVARGTVSSWGDSYGNRVDRFLSGVAYVDNTGLPSSIMARGYYTRTTVAAWNWRDGKLTQLWKFDSNGTSKDAAGHAYTGQGSHSLSIANVDDDPQQEIIYGAMTVDNDGKGLCSTGYNHGDALHVGDFIPSRKGLEVFMCNEDGSHPAYHIRDARTCAIIQAGPVNGNDTGRGVADDSWPATPAPRCGPRASTACSRRRRTPASAASPAPQNFLIWWDADETRELEDGTSITKYGQSGTLLSCSQCASNNGTKATPALTADLLGDWREEVIWRESDNSALRIYTTTDVTKRRIYTLMHDAQYRTAVAWQNTAYNQPPHPSFHIGSGMADPPKPDITVK